MLGDAVYSYDNDGKQLVQESFSTTSTNLNCNLWINLSHVVTYGLLGAIFQRRPPPLSFYLLNMQCWCWSPWGTCLDSAAGDSLGKRTKTLTLSLMYSSLVAVDIAARFPQDCAGKLHHNNHYNNKVTLYADTSCSETKKTKHGGLFRAPYLFEFSYTQWYVVMKTVSSNTFFKVWHSETSY